MTFLWFMLTFSSLCRDSRCPLWGTNEGLNNSYFINYSHRRLNHQSELPVHLSWI